MTPPPLPTPESNRPPDLLPQDAVADLQARSEEFPPVLQVAGRRWVQVGTLRPADRASAADHRLALVDVLDQYRTRNKFRYPDLRVVEDTGIGWHGGSARWTLRGLVPGREVLVVVRTLLRGDLAPLTLTVAGQAVVQHPGRPHDRPHPWFNLVLVVPGQHVVAAEVDLGLAAERGDLLMYTCWFYQVD